MGECFWVATDDGVWREVMPEFSKVGKRGTIVIPVELRRRYGFEEDSLVLIEEQEDGVLLRPAVAMPTAEYRRQFLAETNHAYADLRQNRGAWAEELAERRVLEGTLADDLEADADRAAAWVKEAPPHARDAGR